MASHQEELVPLAEDHKAAKAQISQVASRTLHPNAVDLYLVDLLSLIGSGISLGGLIILLTTFDGHPQPQWTSISLNTIASWLSTITRALLVLVLSRNIGQLKWIWMSQHPRPLADLCEFDKASRGAVGGFALSSRKLRHVHTLGTSAMILAIGIGPFIQNTIHTYLSPLPDPYHPATLSSSTSYSEKGPTVAANTYYVHPVLRANVYSSLFDGGDSQPWSIPSFNCPTGNCTFDPAVTLSMHARCTDLTDNLRTSCIEVEKTGATPGTEHNCTWSLPSDVSIWNREGAGGRAVGLNIANTNDGIYANQSFINPVQYIKNKAFDPSQILNGTALPTSSFAAAECMLEACVDVIKSNVSSSVYSEELIASWCGQRSHADITGDWATETAKHGFPGNSTPMSQGNGVWLPPGFALDDATALAIKYFFANIFEGQVKSNNGDVTSSGSDAYLPYAASDVLQTIYYGNFTRCSGDALECAFSNIAKAMTKTFRDGASPDNNTAVGSTLVMVTYIDIQYAWLALPIAVWLLAAIQFALTAWKTTKAHVPAWSNSLLPFLTLNAAALDDRALQSAARKKKVKLVLHEGKVDWQAETKTLRQHEAVA